MSPGIARCSTCGRKLPIRVTEELVRLLEMAHLRRVVVLTVQCPSRTCRAITRIRLDDIIEDKAA